MQARPGGTEVIRFDYRSISRLSIPAGSRSIFAQVGDEEYIDEMEIKNNQLHRSLRKEKHRAVRTTFPISRQGIESVETGVRIGAGKGFVVDTIELPFDNPWESLCLLAITRFSAMGLHCYAPCTAMFFALRIYATRNHLRQRSPHRMLARFAGLVSQPDCIIRLGCGSIRMGFLFYAEIRSLGSTMRMRTAKSIDTSALAMLSSLPRTAMITFADWYEIAKEIFTRPRAIKDW